MKSRVRGWVSVLAAGALLCSATGCFGSFGLTRKVYSFNNDVHENKWVQEGVYLGLNFPLLPVYVLAGLFDSVFFNSVEFWTGETLIAVEPAPAAEPKPAAMAPAQKPQAAPAKPAAPRKARSK